MQTYQCVACEKHLPESEFRVVRGSRIKRCRPCHNEQIYEWRRKNKDRVKEHKRRYHEKHKEEINAKVREWQQMNRERTVDLAHVGRARRYGAEEVELVERWVVYERDGGLCHACGKHVSKKEFQVDHVIPLSCGGSHTYDNVRTSHRRCNLARR